MMLLLAFALTFSSTLLFWSDCQACNINDYNTATNDTITPFTSIPRAPSVSTSLSQTLNITSGYNYFPVSWTSGYPSWSPIIDPQINMITITNGIYNSGNTGGRRAWNGTIFPNSTADSFFTIYNNLDHGTNIYHKITFYFKQLSSNLLRTDEFPKVSIDLSIFDINELDTSKWPNDVGDTWINGGLNDDTSQYTLELNSDSLDNGIDYIDDDNSWIQFPSVLAHEWTKFEVVFRLDSEENVPACDSCYPALVTFSFMVFYISV